MPLTTTITRDDQPVPIMWTEAVVAAMVIVASVDNGDDQSIFQQDATLPDFTDPDKPYTIRAQEAFMIPSYPMIGMTPLNHGPYTVTGGPYYFYDPFADQEVVIKPGDVLNAVRS